LLSLKNKWEILGLQVSQPNNNLSSGNGDVIFHSHLMYVCLSSIKTTEWGERGKRRNLFHHGKKKENV